MAFSFYGTFTTAQFELLRAFSKIQEKDLANRKKWLLVQLERNGVFITSFNPETYMPVSYEVSYGSYAYKLMIAYKSLGGTPESDFILRTTDQPVFLTRTTALNSSDQNSGYSDVFNNGKRIRGGQRFDRDIGIQVNKLKFWQLEAIKRKREHLEFKIKRALDYSDQLQREIDLLSILLDSAGLATVDDLISKIQLYMFRPGSQNIVQDVSDIFGFNIGRIMDKTNPDDYEDKTGTALR